jgi:hypothetical protein
LCPESNTRGRQCQPRQLPLNLEPQNFATVAKPPGPERKTVVSVTPSTLEGLNLMLAEDAASREMEGAG